MSSEKKYLSGYELIPLPRHHHNNGNLTEVAADFLPFRPKRVFYIYDIPAGASRGEHGHKRDFQFIVAISGSFSIKIDTGQEITTVTLSRPFEGLLVYPGTWISLTDFSAGSVCLVLCSGKYDAEEYLNSYQEFTDFIKT